MSSPARVPPAPARRVTRAMTSVSGAAAAGGAAGVGALAGAPIEGVLLLGVLGWGTRVALAIPRWRGGRLAADNAIDPFALQDPWRTFVWEAKRARRRIDEAAGRISPGPLRDRFETVARRIDVAVEEIWRIAQAGHALADARKHIDTRQLSGEIDKLGLAEDERPDPDSRTGRTLAAIEAQLASAERLDTTIADTRDQLRLLDARLGEAVTRAIELSVRSSDSASLHGLDDDIDRLVDEMEAIRLALAETDATGLGEPPVPRRGELALPGDDADAAGDGEPPEPPPDATDR